MERIELFDNYINNRLSDEQRSEFDARLKSDENFASDFKVYLFTIDGICREAHQDNLDFGVAMKKLTKEQLREIIGPRHEKMSAAAASAVPDAEASNPKIIRFKPWMWHAASIAAVVVIAFVAVFKVEQNSRYNVDDAIFACADLNTDLARSGSEAIDISSMNDGELKAAIPALTNQYMTTETTDEIADNGYALAMVYLKLHDRDKAKDILNQLISRFDGNEDYAESVAKWKSILNLIK